MKNTKKLIGFSTLLISLLLFVIIFLSSAYEFKAYSAYAKTANIDKVYVMLVLTLYMLFSTPIAFMGSILLLIAGVKYLRGTAGKKTRIITLVVKAISAIGLLVLFILYVMLYPTGWVSKAFYLATSLLSTIAFFMDFYLVDTTEQTKDKNKKYYSKK